MNLASQGNFNQYFSAEFVMSRFWPTCKKRLATPILELHSDIHYWTNKGLCVLRILKILK